MTVTAEACCRVCVQPDVTPLPGPAAPRCPASASGPEPASSSKSATALPSPPGLFLPHQRSPHRLRRTGTRHSKIWHEHPRRTPQPRRQQATQTSLLPRCLHHTPRPRQPDLLRPQTGPRQEAQRRTRLPRPTPHRRHPRHAQTRHPLRRPIRPSCCLTEVIGTPPPEAGPHREPRPGRLTEPPGRRGRRHRHRGRRTSPPHRVRFRVNRRT